MAQVDARAIGQGQLALARAEDHDGAVGRIDDLAVAVHAQLCAMGVQHGAAVEAQAIFRGQVDAADALATGIHQAGHAQAAVVDRDVDAVGLDVTADGQVALLELEAARTIDLALVEALVERGELVAEDAIAAQALGLDFHRAGEVRHQGATGIVATAAAGDDLARQVDDPRCAVHRHRAQPARLVVLRRQVDGRARGLAYIACAAFQQHLAACAVFGQVVEGNGPTGHINRGGIGEHHIATGTQGHFAAGHHHGTGQAQAVTLQRQLTADTVYLAHRAGRGADIYCATGGNTVDRTGLPGHQRREDIQIAAAVGKALDRVKRALALVHREAAFVVGGDALAGIEVDVGKTQGEAIEGFSGARLGKSPIAELDAFGIDVQAPAAAAGTTGHRRRRRCLGTLPDQVGGVDGGHVVGTARTVDRRRGEHQVAQQRLAGHRVVGVQGGGAVEVETVARRQLQGFQGRGAELGVAAQQAFQHLLVEGHAHRQPVTGGRGGQGFGAADVDAGHPQVQVAGAIAHLIPHLQGAVGQGNDAAFGIQGRLAAAGRAVAHA
ncbi:hypothetical protein [Pseudomonas sp. 22 E 5]|nr:hypothetical protein [Pseudomonas sp. 31 E 5]CRM58032.1 hypothetical protein [Pseudomonas sp. 31 E 6]CRM88166.1 hypothetical protein [Pseudomonas sp. 22 E 5]